MELNRERLAEWLASAVEARSVTIQGVERLSGGAIQESVALDVVIDGGPRAGSHALVLRASAKSTLPVSWDRAQEFAILRVAHGAGVTVPEPWVVCTDVAVLGRPFYVMARARGEARGFRLVRDPEVVSCGGSLVARLAQEIARLHRLEPPLAGLEFMAVPSEAPARARIDQYRRYLDSLGASEPTLEWALSWLERRAPAPLRICLIHGDFRTGNFLVDRGELTAILDWEFAGFGDPREDLGWMLARYWRFGAYEREAGGLASREALLGAYEGATGQPVDRAAVDWWEVMATVRWAVIALMQAERHRSGAERSLELALTAHVVPVLELDLLARIAALESDP
jgi:aminoglycoside phosphotransferase (APT) family kinase protein